MARAPVTVAGLTFPTKGVLDAHVRHLRDRYPGPGGVPIPPASADHAFLLALIERHPRYPEKFAAGVAGFVVDDDQIKDRCFYTVTPLGHRDDFSFKLCILGRSRTDDQMARDAARDVLRQHVYAFRRARVEAGDARCALCAHPVTGAVAHVDHERPATFLALWRAFHAAQAGLDDTTIVPDAARPGVRHFVSPATTARWRAFHAAHARLRLLCRRCNLSDARRRAPHREHEKEELR